LTKRLPTMQTINPVLTERGQELAKALQRWNIAVAIVHLTSFTVLLIITLTTTNRFFSRPLYVDFGGSVRVIAAQPLAVTLLPFQAITGVIHILQALGALDYYTYALARGVTPHRWLEYAVTNGLMTWSVFLLSGCGNVVVLVAALLVNITMQAFGWIHEAINARRQRTLQVLWAGFLPWLALWLIPLTYYIATARTQPLFVGFAVIGTFLLSITFTLPLFWRYRTEDPALEANYKAERAYEVLSLTAKIYLEWVVAIGLLTSNELVQ